MFPTFAINLEPKKPRTNTSSPKILIPILFIVDIDENKLQDLLTILSKQKKGVMKFPQQSNLFPGLPQAVEQKFSIYLWMRRATPEEQSDEFIVCQLDGWDICIFNFPILTPFPPLLPPPQFCCRIERISIFNLNFLVQSENLYTAISRKGNGKFVSRFQRYGVGISCATDL